MHSLSSLTKTLSRTAEKHGILLAGIVIFAYYLWSAINLFNEPRAHHTFQEYFFQFDSLLLLWLLLWTGLKVLDYRKKQREESDRHRRIALEFERQKMRLDLLDEVTTTLTDAVNNPMSIITLSSGSIRERFTADSEVVANLDRIDGALRRLREVLADFQGYQTRKMLAAVETQAKGAGSAKQAGETAAQPPVLPAAGLGDPRPLASSS